MTLLGKGTGACRRTRSSGMPPRARAASSTRARWPGKVAMRRVTATGGHSSGPAPTRSVTSTICVSLTTPTRIARSPPGGSGEELGHHVAGEQLEGPEGLRVLDAAEADLHRRLDLAE